VVYDSLIAHPHNIMTQLGSGSKTHKMDSANETPDVDQGKVYRSNP